MTHDKVKSVVIANLAHPAMELGGDAKKLPLHITVVPPFRHDRIATSHISRLISEELEHTEPFTVMSHAEVMLGMNEKDGVLARKVGSRALHRIHNLIVPVVQEFPGVEIDTQFAYDKYTPHATRTETQRLNNNESRYIDALYLFQKIKLSHSHPAWYVAAKYPLGKGNEATS